MVKHIDSEDEVENSVTEKPIRAKAKLPCSLIKQNASTATSQRPTKPHARATKKEVVNVTVAVSTGSPDSRSKMVDIPRFMIAAWSTSFLPMLYDSLGRSKKPFVHFSKGLDIVSKLQLVWFGRAQIMLSNGQTWLVQRSVNQLVWIGNAPY